jgi:hypothetical protein
VQQTAARHEELIALLFARHDAQGDVGFQLPHEPITQLAARDIGPFLAAEGRIVDAEEHVEGRLIDLDRRQGDRVVDVRDRVADVDLLQADHGTDVAGADLVRFDAAQPVERVKLLDDGVDAAAVVLHHGDALILANLAGVDLADRDPADVVTIVE